mmetsp:Transcript_47417/g.152236  ORF Transcript_47417/g.152236 Transcript_47417/m.152236 type:complete len:113 (-) Transcript_47417:72-410(-)
MSDDEWTTFRRDVQKELAPVTQALKFYGRVFLVCFIVCLVFFLMSILFDRLGVPGAEPLGQMGAVMFAIVFSVLLVMMITLKVEANRALQGLNRICEGFEPRPSEHALDGAI